MLPLDVYSSMQKLDDKIQLLEVVMNQIEHEIDGLDFAKIQTIAANYLAVAASGLLETGVQTILVEFAENHSSPRVSKYVERELSWKSTLNCHKIDSLLAHFEPSWKEEFCKRRSKAQRDAINSLKTLRDCVAHGKHNGTRYTVVKDYYKKSTDVLNMLAEIVNP